MQTIYCTTSHFIRHSGNVIDLAEYRRRMERAARPQIEAKPPRQEGEPVEKRGRGIPGRMERGLFLDYCASVAVLVMTVVAVVQFLTV